MRKVEVGLRVAALQTSTWALFTYGRDKVIQRSLPIAALLLLGLMIAVLSLARIPAEDTLGAQNAPRRVESIKAERIGSHDVTDDAGPTPVVKSDIVLPDIFIPVPADIVPAQKHSSVSATQNGTFKHSER